MSHLGVTISRRVFRLLLPAWAGCAAPYAGPETSPGDLAGDARAQQAICRGASLDGDTCDFMRSEYEAGRSRGFFALPPLFGLADVAPYLTNVVERGRANNFCTNHGLDGDAPFGLNLRTGALAVGFSALQYGHYGTVSRLYWDLGFGAAGARHLWRDRAVLVARLRHREWAERRSSGAYGDDSYTFPGSDNPAFDVCRDGGAWVSAAECERRLLQVPREGEDVQFFTSGEIVGSGDGERFVDGSTQVVYAYQGRVNTAYIAFRGTQQKRDALVDGKLMGTPVETEFVDRRAFARSPEFARLITDLLISDLRPPGPRRRERFFERFLLRRGIPGLADALPGLLDALEAKLPSRDADNAVALIRPVHQDLVAEVRQRLFDRLSAEQRTVLLEGLLEGLLEAMLASDNRRFARRAHRGFWGALVGFTDEKASFDVFGMLDTKIRMALQKHPDMKLVVTGHSLGAALGTAFVLRAMLPDGSGRPVPWLSRVDALATAGSPRLVTPMLAAMFDFRARQLGIPAMRFVHEDDLVTTIPPRDCRLGLVLSEKTSPPMFRHVGLLAHMPTAGKGATQSLGLDTIKVLPETPVFPVDRYNQERARECTSLDYLEIARSAGRTIGAHNVADLSETEQLRGSYLARLIRVAQVQGREGGSGDFFYCAGERRPLQLRGAFDLPAR